LLTLAVRVSASLMRPTGSASSKGKKMKIHDRGNFWNADEIAECLEVTGATRGELWQCVRLYESLPRGEAPGEFSYPLSEYGWSSLSKEAQLDVNAAFDKYEEEERERREHEEEDAAQAAAEDPERHIRYHHFPHGS
jgi:hypothetical protein